jgi:hypothetical protein
MSSDIPEPKLIETELAIRWASAAPGKAQDADYSVLVEKLKRACKRYHELPKKKEFLASLVASVDEALAAAKELLRAHIPPLGSKRTLYDLVSRVVGSQSELYGGKRAPPDDRKLYFLLKWQGNLEPESQFLHGLLHYAGPIGKQLVREALGRRYHRSGDVLMVGLDRGHMAEFLDPLHRSHPDLQKSLSDWLQQQMDSGEDPAETLIDFLLDWSDRKGGGNARSMSTDRLRSHELKFKEGRVYAYYAAGGGHEKENDPEKKIRYDTVGRYYNRDHDDLATVLSVHLKKYDSQGGGGQGAADRDGDFVMGDTYVVGKNGKFYSFSGSTIHSEFFSGAPVQAAGGLVASDGLIEAIDNRSGHYRPGWKILLQAVELLANEGVFAREAIVALVANPVSTMFFTVRDFIQLARREFPFPETTKVVRGYQERYQNRIPVPASRMTCIADVTLRRWPKGPKADPVKDPDNQWDLFFRHFYGNQGAPKDIAQLKPRSDWASPA